MHHRLLSAEIMRNAKNEINVIQLLELIGEGYLSVSQQSQRDD
jgi:hypothetical protein